MEQHVMVDSPPAEPSPWWLRGAAIVLGIFSFMMIFNVIAGASAPFLYDMMPTTEEICGEEPENQGSDEHDAWVECRDTWPEIEAMVDELEDSKILELSGLHSALLILLSLPTIFFLWTGEREIALKMSWAWIAINFIGTMVIVWKYTQIDTFVAGGEVDPEFERMMQTFTTVSSYAQTVICNLTAAALLILVSIKSKPQTDLVIPSAFHSNTEMGQH